MVDLFLLGLPPVAGGTLDQAQGLIDAAYFIKQETAFWKRKFKVTD